MLHTDFSRSIHSISGYKYMENKSFMYHGGVLQEGTSTFSLEMMLLISVVLMLSLAVPSENNFISAGNKSL